jgi:hypothetical protein
MMEETEMMVESASTATPAADCTTTTADCATSAAASALRGAAAASATPVVEGLSATGACDQQRCAGHDSQNQCLTKHQGISLHFGTLKTPIP